jgi:Carboxypeptidase regulatory-like domain
MAMRHVSVAFRVVAFVAFVVLASLPLLCQTNTGRILGTITDQTGAAINAATVIVTDVQRGVTRSLTTDEAGAYVAPNLLSGTYKVHAEAKGFKTVERINIVLEVAKDVVVDLQLPAGEVKETVVVTEEVPLLDTASSTLGGTLSNVEINDLPSQWPELREPPAASPGSGEVSRGWILHDQHERLARGRQRLRNRRFVQ